MRRIALLGLTLLLSGCGNTWWNPPFTGGFSPNRPQADSANALRAMGQAPDLPPLMPEPGDIWPGPQPPTPTLQEMEHQMNAGQRGDVQPANPPRNGGGPMMSPNPVQGSSTPPGAVMPALPPQAGRPVTPPYAAAPPAPPPHGPAGQTYQTRSGPVVTNGGGPGYQTTTLPGGGSGIIIPNGNGTSTIIRSDGKMETVPTPH